MSHSLGGWFAGISPEASGITAGNSWVLLFISALMPVFLLFGKRPVVVLGIWLAVFSLGLLAGFEEAVNRNNRHSATAPGFMKPAVAVLHHTKSMIRTTGWASTSQDGRWRIPAILLNVQNQDDASSARKKPQRGDGLMLSGTGEPPLPGEIRAVALEISVPAEGDLPGMFDHRLFLAGRGIQWKGKVLNETVIPERGIITAVFKKFLHPVRSNVLERLKILMPPLEASLASAVLLGAKDESSRAASNPFSDLGLAHLFAVSGLHVGVLLGLFLLPGKLLGISAFQKWLFLLLILPPYALLTGLPGSVVRAAGLAMLASAGMPLGRSSPPLHLLGVLFWATTIWNPDQVLDTGVRLSYSAAAGILGFTSISRGIDFPRHGFRGFVLGGLFISLAAQWSTLPLAATSFGRLSLISPLANLLAVPTFGLGVWLVVLSLAASIFPWAAGEYFGSWAWLVFRSLSGIVSLTEGQTGGWNLGLPVPSPFTIILWIVASGASLGMLKMVSEGRLRGKRALYAICAIGLLMVGSFSKPFRHPMADIGPQVWQFDVGQGDCSVLRFPDGWSVMIDTAGLFGFSGKTINGPLSRSVIPWLKRFNHHNFDSVLLTHGHLDHTGGVKCLRTESWVGQWLGSEKALHSLLPDTSGLAITQPEKNEILHHWGDWTFQICYPFSTLPENLHENDRSLVVSLQHQGQTQMLWSGDLEKEGEALLLAGKEFGGSARVWKAGHHGSNTSGSDLFMQTIHPELILISCGVGNGYKHPSHDLYIVSGDTIPVLRTDLEGSIHLNFRDNGEITWKTRNGDGLLPAPP